MHRLGFIFSNDNLWQLKERKDDPVGGNRAECTSGLQNGVSNVSEPRAVQVQNESDRLVRAMSLTIGDVASSLTNETMPCRHRGQAIEPGGP
ncbi:hypothetical protein AgCh_037234 [Apium graveolens]